MLYSGSTLREPLFCNSLDHSATQATLCVEGGIATPVGNFNPLTFLKHSEQSFDNTLGRQAKGAAPGLRDVQ